MLGSHGKGRQTALADATCYHDVGEGKGLAPARLILAGKWLGKSVSRWLARAVFAVLCVLGLAVGILSVTQTRTAREFALRQASSAIRDELGLNAWIGDVYLDPVQMAVVAREITLDHPQHGRLAEARILRIQPSLLALSQGKVDLETIEIEDAVVTLRVRDGRVLNLFDLPKGSAKPSRIELPFQSLELKRARLAVDASPVASGELSRVNIQLDASDSDSLRVRAGCSEGFVDHPAGRELIERVRVEAEASSDSLQLDVLQLQTPELSLAVRKAAVGFPLGEHYRGNVELIFDVSRLHQWPHGVTLPPLSGQLRLQASIANDGDGPSMEGKVWIRDGRIKGYGLGERVELALTASRDRMGFKGTSQLIRNGGTVHIDGHVGLGGALPLSVQVGMQGIGFAKLMEQLGVTPDAVVDWNLTGGFELQGALDPFDISGPLHVDTTDFRVTAGAWHERRVRPILHIGSARVDGVVRVKSDGIHLLQMRVALPNSNVEADALLGFDDTLRVQGGSQSFRLADCSPLAGFEVAGQGTFAVDVSGTFGKPAIQGGIAWNGFALETFGFGDLKGDFVVEKDTQAVRFPLLKAEKLASRYRVHDLTLDFTNDRFMASGALAIDRLRMTDLYHVFHYHEDERYTIYQGVVTGESQVRYTMDFPGDSPAGTMVADIDVEIPEAELSGFAFRDGHFKGQWKWLDHTQGYRGGQLAVERFALRKGEGTLNISGRMDLDGVLNMVAVADRLSVHDIEGLGRRLPDLGGSLALTGTIKGTADLPRAEFDLALASMNWQGRLLGDGRLYVRLTDKDDPWVREAMQWRPGSPPLNQDCGHARSGFAHGTWPPDPPLKTKDGPKPALDQPMAYLVCGKALGGRVSLDMAFGRTKRYPLRGIVNVSDLQLAPLIPRGPQKERLQAALSGSLQIRDGAAQDPARLAGHLEVGKFELASQGVALRNEGPVSVDFGDGGFRISHAKFRAHSSDLRISGHGSVHKGLALEVDGHIDLGLLASLSHTVSQTSGTLGLHFEIEGPFDRPAVNGHASVRDAALLFATFPEPIRELNGTVTFNKRRILLENFRARAAGGHLYLHGSAELQGRELGRYGLDIEASGLTLADRDEFEAIFGGQVELKWQRGETVPTLAGTVKVEKLLYTRSMQTAPQLSDMYRGRRAPVERYDPDRDRLALDLRVVHSRPLEVQNNLLDAELVIQDSEQPFRIVGTDQRFGILGNMTFKRGIVRFRDADFDIREGAIAFGNPHRIDPQFDVLAVTDLRRTGEVSTTTWHITLRAKGNRESFTLETSSDPYLAQEDIALLLAIGMTRAEIEQGRTGDLTETAALEALASVTGVNREVRKALPAIDDFRIKSAYSEHSHRTEPQVSIGKRIADRVRLNASSGLAESGDFSTGLEWQLSDQTSVEAVYDNQNTTGASQLGDLGVDLSWRLEFD